MSDFHIGAYIAAHAHDRYVCLMLLLLPMICHTRLEVVKKIVNMQMPH